MKKEDFEKVVERALESLPEEFTSQLHNIEIVIEDGPEVPNHKGMILLGLYQGVPLNKRTHYYAGVLPDKITLFKKSIEEICRNESEMVTEIQRTLLHELGHYFGIDDKKLRQLGF